MKPMKWLGSFLVYWRLYDLVTDTFHLPPSGFCPPVTFDFKQTYDLCLLRKEGLGPDGGRSNGVTVLTLWIIIALDMGPRQRLAIVWTNVRGLLDHDLRSLLAGASLSLTLPVHMMSSQVL
jgi:hypothetical protein